ncbi:MAG TPA: response regulator [Trichocoleus sp.]
MSTSSGDAQTPYHSATSLFPRPTPPAPPHAYAQITVTDTGIGISPGFLPYVFDYFRQEDGKTTRRFGGLGLGLAIVRYLSELHGGMVTAASPGEGQGATFTVRLPLAPVQPPNGSASTAQQDVDLSHLHILVVDDEADMRALMQAVLQRYGARVSVAASAAEALALLDQLRPDVLVSDIGMPEVDGYTMMRQIRGSAADWGDGPAVGHRSLKAIALTAYAAETDQQQALAAGFQQHLAKPIEPEVLAQAILALAGKP